MKIKKELITKSNIKSIYGRLNKFLLSLDGAYDYTVKHWKSNEPYASYKNYFMVSKTKLKDACIYVELPVIFNINLGDRIAFNGNRIIIQRNIKQYDNSIYSDYCVYERKNIKILRENTR